MEKHANDSENMCQFGFDSNEITYQSQNSNYTVKWDIIKGYTENKGDLYLFKAKKELFDIISTDLIGEEKYNEFKLIVLEKSISSFQ